MPPRLTMTLRIFSIRFRTLLLSAKSPTSEPLLNAWFRERDGNVLITKDEDIKEAFKLWEKISMSQEYSIPPYIFDIYKDVMLPLFKKKNNIEILELDKALIGLSRKEIIGKYYEMHGTFLDSIRLRQQIIPMLETAGLITQEKDPDNKRQLLIFPMVDFN